MNNITIDEVKDILKCSIDETTNMNEAIERTLQQIYLKGWNDAENSQVNEILRKIEKEMKGLLEAERQIYGKNTWRFVNKCIEIIDKYKAESEVDDDVKNSYLAIKSSQRESCEDEDIAKAFQLGLALGFGEKYDKMDRVIDEIKKVITPQYTDAQIQKMQEMEQAGIQKAYELGEAEMQEIGHCKDCKYFEYCKRWGNGCKTREDGYCFMFEPRESEKINCKATKCENCQNHNYCDY